MNDEDRSLRMCVPCANGQFCAIIHGAAHTRHGSKILRSEYDKEERAGFLEDEIAAHCPRTRTLTVEPIPMLRVKKS